MRQIMDRLDEVSDSFCRYGLLIFVEVDSVVNDSTRSDLTSGYARKLTFFSPSGDRACGAVG